ncbi:MAG: glycosyltransferase family 4 protein [Phocaeicola plebeius]
MRVLIINTSEKTGGAAIAARRLMEALKKSGIKAKMLVRDKQTDDVTVVPLRKSWRNIWNFVWERIIIWRANHFHKQHLFAMDIANTGTDITSLPEFQQADVIHLHWVNQGMLSLNNLRQILDAGKPVVWTLHDMWPVTGICHHAETCDRFATHCHHCPLLVHGHRHDLSYRIFEKKRRLYTRGRLSFIACSHWLEEQARRSALTQGHPVTSIPNPIDTRLFHPIDRQQVRKELGLPADKCLLLFSSMKITDKRKGIDYLVEACQLLQQTQPDFSRRLEVVVMGHESEEYSRLFPFPVHCLDYRSQEKDIARVYNAVDLYVTPSLMENLPNTLMEAMACGVPCVGFHIGGIPEMIDHLHNGYVAQYKSAADLANGIYWSLNDGNYPSLSEAARRKVTNCYGEETIARAYIHLYNQITDEHE